MTKCRASKIICAIFVKIITRRISDVIDIEEMEGRFVASSRDLFPRPPFISVSLFRDLADRRA